MKHLKDPKTPINKFANSLRVVGIILLVVTSVGFISYRSETGNFWDVYTLFLLHLGVAGAILAFIGPASDTAARLCSAIGNTALRNGFGTQNLTGLVKLLQKGAGTSKIAAVIILDILRCSVIFLDLRFSVNFTLVCCFVLERRQLPRFTLAPDPLPRARRLSSSL